MGKILWRSLLQVVVSVGTFYECFLPQVELGPTPSPEQGRRRPGQRASYEGPQPCEVGEQAAGSKGGKGLPSAGGRRQAGPDGAVVLSLVASNLGSAGHILGRQEIQSWQPRMGQVMGGQ